MTWDSLIAFNLVLMAAILAPGAALLYFLKSTMSAGRAAGLATGCGLATAAAGWTLAALLGLESLFHVFPWTYTALKAGGALYLLWIAVQTWRHARDPMGQAPTMHSRAALGGFLVNAGNPKSMLFAAAVIVVVFPQGLGALDITIIVANHWLLEILFYGAAAFFLSTPVARNGYLGLKVWFDRIAATMLGALGLRLLLEK